MVRKKGYIGLSVSLLILFTALFLLYNSQPAAALMCNQDDCYYCYDYYDFCRDIMTGYDKYSYYSNCGGGCSGPCEAIADCCVTSLRAKTLYGCRVCASGQYWDGSNCVQDSVCGNDVCEAGEDGWNCPKYPDGSGGGDCPCIATSRSCNGAGVFEHYSNCQGKQVIASCPYGCVDDGNWDRCKTECEGVSCNSPPAAYCSGNTRVYYNSAGT